jgi:hypothetical protein
MRRHLPGSLLIVALVCGCQQASSPDSPAGTDSAQQSSAPAPSPFRIMDVSTGRDRIDPTTGEQASISYTIDAAAMITLQIYDGRDALIYRGEPEQVEPGTHSLTWDGRDASGEPVPPEAYHYVLHAENASGTVTHDLTDATGGEALLAEEPVWDADSGQLRFRLHHPSRINVRFGLADGPYVRTVVDWVARDAGDHVVAWDGWDASQAMNLAKHPMISPTVRAYTLPGNTIFVGPDADQVQFVSMPPLGMREKQTRPVKTRMFFHADQPLETRGDVPMEFSILGEHERDEQGRHVVSGMVPIRLDVPGDVRARVLERRFEPVFFVDGIFVFEIEMGMLPMTWQWDSTVVNPGEHYITTNIRGYEGNYGAATLRVWVEPETSGTAAASTPTMETMP